MTEQDFIPTTEEVRDDYSYCGEYVPREMEKREDFDRWLAKHDTELIAKHVAESK